jgi:hypothetical protein
MIGPTDLLHPYIYIYIYMYSPSEVRGPRKRTMTVMPRLHKICATLRSFGRKLCVKGRTVTWRASCPRRTGRRIQMVNLNAQNCTFVRCVHYQCTQRTWSKSPPPPPKPAGTQHNNGLHSCQMFTALYLAVLNVPHSHRCVVLGTAAVCELFCG